MLNFSNNEFVLNFCSIFVLICATNYGYALFAVQNERRQLDSLDGLWTFVREPPNSVGIGLQNQWASLELALFENSSQIPVPSAFNDLTADSEQRDHVGWVWYQRKYFLSHFLRDAPPNGRRTFLRFESVNYYAFVFVNGKLVTEHCGGHLPFQVEVQLVDVNLISVAVNNTLSHDTIPPGDFATVKLSSGRELVSVVPSFDFFNYAGILRSVYLWHLPPIFIRDIQIRTDNLGSFSYRIDVDRDAHPAEDIRIHVFIFQSDGAKKIYEFFGSQNSTTFAKIDLWWPRGMGKPTLYTAEVRLESFSSVGSKYLLSDVYRETFGFRTVTVDQNRIYINGRPFYCHGFGMHEDIGIHGRGFDLAAMVKDMNMFEWLNGNCYRTSHYPYAEERAYWADRRGIAVITEVPAVGIWNFNSSELLKLHGKMIAEMVSRDRNHPSVIMWSLSNEPKMPSDSAPYEYFKNLVTLTKQLDATRPVTVVFGHASAAVKVASLLDVICVNEYFGWYSNIGIEYGAEAISGFNEQPSVPFSEQYQAELIQETGKAVDELRCSEDIAGEMLWNFADFMTAPSVSRAIGNHKGVLTRERKPKLGAYAIQKRYKTLLENNSTTSFCPAKLRAM
ncbi:hypothetical protein niasHT_002629 [Heterodera trifolii]|uniref:Beta-glucuronidase n=1 Tax=Heterodera trifolii TaxID=157864 RepID=A0ABD2LU63_9BILA